VPHTGLPLRIHTREDEQVVVLDGEILMRLGELRDIGSPRQASMDGEHEPRARRVLWPPRQRRGFRSGVARCSPHYGLTIATCVPADPQSKGGSEATVRIARADLVPTEHNLRAAYASFSELDAECAVFCERVNAREHRVPRRAPAVMLAEERGRLHPLAKAPHTVCFGQTRRVCRQSTISVGGAVYSVPSKLVDERVWVRVDGSELVVVHADGPARAARGRSPQADHARPTEHPR
jgi:hypothetical protein